MTFCFINGSYRTSKEALISVEDRGFNFSDGVYEVIAFRSKKLLNFSKHISRLNNSLKNLRIRNPFSNTKSIEIISNYLFDINNLEHGFIYLQITRGTSKRNHLFPDKVTPNIIIFTFANNKKSGILKKGVKIGLTKDQRWSRCDIKSISLLPNVLDKQKGYENGFFEMWQIKNNYITEGTTSNAFIVNKKNEILTHPKNNFILGGVARDCVIKIAKSNHIKVLEKAFSINDIRKCNEAFLTSTTLGIIPVVQVENFS